MNMRQISQFTLERYLLGELSTQEKRLIDQQLSRDPNLALRLSELEKSNRMIRIQYSAADQSRAIGNKLSRNNPTNSNFKMISLGNLPKYLALAASVSFLVGIGLWSLDSESQDSLPHSLSSQGSVIPKDVKSQGNSAVPLAQSIRNQGAQFVQESKRILDRSIPQSSLGNSQVAILDPLLGVRSKGALKLELWLKRGDSAQRITTGTQLRSGSVLQMRLNVNKASYVAVFSVDGRGEWTNHTEQTIKVLKPGKQSLASAYELDDAPYWESFCLIQSTHDFRSDSLFKFIKSQTKYGIQAPKNFPLANDYEQSCVVVLK